MLEQSAQETVPTSNIILPTDWGLRPAEHKYAKQLNEQLTSHARRLIKALSEAHNKEEKAAAVRTFYRKFYTLSLCKSCLEVGVNRHPARDFILDFPWKACGQDRFFCLKIWEKVNV